MTGAVPTVVLPCASCLAFTVSRACAPRRRALKWNGNGFYGENE